MTLIETIEVDSNKISFYNGIDFDVLKSHPKDGSDGFIFCFVENFVTEVQSHKRQNKINSVLTSDISTEFNTKDIENNYIAIYQLQGTEPGVLFEVIKQKVITKNFPEHPWIPIAGLKSGAWRIGNSKFSN
jgi:hypothetical protein